MRLIVAGTPEPAVPSLRRLAASPHEIAAVLTRPDAPLGRKRVLTPSPVAHAADELGLSVIRSSRPDDAVAEQIEALDVDLGVVIAYGALLRPRMLAAPRLGWINLHFSLLPRWRGAAPVQRAIMAGDTVTGASVFQLVEALDAGDVFAESRTTIGARQTSGHLLEQLAAEGAELLAEVVGGIGAGTLVARPQEGEVTLAPKLTADDARIDWSAEALSVDALIRGVTPEPGAHTTLDEARFKVLEAVPARDDAPLPPGTVLGVAGRVLVGTGSAPLELLRVQPPGKAAMAAGDWWRGRANASATVLR